MTIEEVNKIDMVGIPKDNQDMVNLVISDHLTWTSPIEEHLYKLQKKLNSYIQSIESGEVYRVFPEIKETKNKTIIIYFKYTPPKESFYFFEETKTILKSIGIEFAIKVL